MPALPIDQIVSSSEASSQDLSEFPTNWDPAGTGTPQEDRELAIAPADYGLLTDLYQLTMTACYVGEGLDQRRASFELFVRRLPENFGYLIAMGLAQALDYLEKLQFSAAQLAALKATGLFDHAPDRFWELLASARFTGDLWAVPEGTAIFANEPILRVEAPLWQAQIVETYLLNTINYQTLIATRAARLRDVAGPDSILLEFGTRRAFSPQASVWAARAAIAAGINATSNVLAALKLGRKPTGTMAHALVMALAATEGSERQAFAAFHRYFPGAPLLIDTYDSIAAAQQLAADLASGQLQHLAGIRLDSGDLVSQSQTIRQLLPQTPIFASGDLDEFKIAQLQAAGACLDGYGLGTQLVTGAPVNGVYKLVDIDTIPVMKESAGKRTYPGRKQVWRQLRDGVVVGDRLGLSTESPSAADDAIALLHPVMQAGKRVQPVESLAAIAERTAQSVAALPAITRQITNPTPITLELSSSLEQLIQQTQHKTPTS